MRAKFKKIDKFNETDRRAVVSELQAQTGSTLSKVGSKRKWFRDEVGRNYWILGGYGQWHGIPEEMMEAEIVASESGMLVVAARRKSNIKIFLGPLSPLVADRNKLSRNQTGDFQFMIKKLGRHLFIEQVTSLRLEEISSFEFGREEEAKVEGLRQFEKLIKRSL